MLFAFLPLVFSAVQAQNSTSPSATQIAVYPPFPIRNGTNMQHTRRAYDVSLITAISTSTLVYAISCSPWTTMTRFNDVCGTSYVPNVITVTESPEEWHWSAQGKSLECTNLREKTKTCMSVTNNYGSDIAPGTQDVGDFLPGFLNYFTTMTPVAVNLTAGFENVPATVLASIENDATGLVTVQTDTPSSSGSEAQSATSAGGSAASSDTARSSRTTNVIAPVLTAPTGAAPRVTGAIGRDWLFVAAGAFGAEIFWL